MKKVAALKGKYRHRDKFHYAACPQIKALEFKKK